MQWLKILRAGSHGALGIGLFVCVGGAHANPFSHGSSTGTHVSAYNSASIVGTHESRPFAAQLGRRPATGAACPECARNHAVARVHCPAR
jgi:hypothetical protein